MSGGKVEQKLTKKQLCELRELLLTQKKELEGQLGSAVSGCDQHSDVADRGNKESEIRLSIHEQARKMAELGQINMALERIEKGIYGQCQHPDCETGHIALPRLRAMPTAHYCLNCQNESEGGRKR